MYGNKEKHKYSLDEIEDVEKNSPEILEIYKNSTFYKERWIKEDGLEQKLIVTYSIKSRNYQRQIRNSQIQSAQKLLSGKPASIKKHHQNDYKRFIQQTGVTPDGEVACEDIFST